MDGPPAPRRQRAARRKGRQARAGAERAGGAALSASAVVVAGRQASEEPGPGPRPSPAQPSPARSPWQRRHAGLRPPLAGAAGGGRAWPERAVRGGVRGLAVVCRLYFPLRTKTSSGLRFISCFKAAQCLPGNATALRPLRPLQPRRAQPCRTRAIRAQGRPGRAGAPPGRPYAASTTLDWTAGHSGGGPGAAARDAPMRAAKIN